MSTEAEIRDLARRFFDAIERGDIDTVYDGYAPEARIWHNTDGREETRDDNAQTLRGFVKLIPERTYAQRRLHVTAGGFVQQHELIGVHADGTRVRLAACIVCAVEAGKITRLDEYFDSAQVAEFIKPARA